MANEILCPRCGSRYTLEEGAEAAAFTCQSCGLVIGLHDGRATEHPTLRPKLRLRKQGEEESGPGGLGGAAPAGPVPASPAPEPVPREVEGVPSPAVPSPAAPPADPGSAAAEEETALASPSSSESPSPPEAESGRSRPGLHLAAKPEGGAGASGNPMVAAMLARQQSDRARRERQAQEAKAARGTLLKRFSVFLISYLLFSVPMMGLQYWAAYDAAYVGWVTTAAWTFLAIVGSCLLVVSLMQGLLQVFLVLGLPFVAFGAVYSVHVYVGLGVLFFYLLYLLYFVFIRLKSPVLKGLFLAFLVTLLGTGPYYLGTDAGVVGPFLDEEFRASLNLPGTRPGEQ